jgi:hypothetical protein
MRENVSMYFIALQMQISGIAGFQIRQDEGISNPAKREDNFQLSTFNFQLK